LAISFHRDKVNGSISTKSHVLNERFLNECLLDLECI
jgi:hypothetical protein